MPNQGQVLYLSKEQRQVLTPQVASEHEIQNEETVLVILEGVAHVHDERMINLVEFHANSRKTEQVGTKPVSDTKFGTDTSGA